MYFNDLKLYKYITFTNGDLGPDPLDPYKSVARFVLGSKN